MILDLQQFAEEVSDSQVALDTEGVDATESTPEAVETSTPEVVQEKPTFDELIKGDYKKDYDKALKKAISKRFKNQANLQSQLDGMNPLLDLVSQKYGVAKLENGYDVETLTRKLEEDNSMYEQEAFERGIDVDTLKQIKQLERQNANLQRQQREAEQRAGFERLVQQAEQVKQIYPDFDLDAEMCNEAFGRLIANNVDCKTAYEVIHKDELMTQGMQYAVQHTKESVAKDIQSGQNRPKENGTQAQSSSSVGAIDLTKLTLKDLADYKRRAANGERITFA